MTKKKSKKKILSPIEKKQQMDQRIFGSKIKSIFRNLWFQYIKTNWIERFFGDKKWELDYIFLYENIIIVCEDTISKTSEVKDHLKNKSILFSEIEKNKGDFIDWLKTDYSDTFNFFDEYENINRYKICYLYASKNPPLLSENDIRLFKPIIIIDDEDLSYFQKITGNIKYSARNEFFRYLALSSNDIWGPLWSSSSDSIKTPIIVPQDNTKLKSGARIVSFMMSAEKLMKNAYVLRKDNWEESIGLYQRLIEKWRIQSIRTFLAKNEETFLNNIIVTLPDGVRFENDNGEMVDIDMITDFWNYKLIIPDEINSICIIDWQHRIYAHYEWTDVHEATMKRLRKKLHLLVTGLIFPKTLSSIDRRTAESEIFLNINSNSKPVPPDVLLHIETLKDPFSDVWVARLLLQELNKGSLFTGLFELSLIKKAPIKISSIIKFALRYLVDIKKDRETLFKYWSDPSKDVLMTWTSTEKEAKLKEYIEFCSNYLNIYFSTIREIFKDEWEDIEWSKILSTTSINGFILALRGSLRSTNIQEREYYKKAFSKLAISFRKGDKSSDGEDKFPFTSSQYAQFSRLILKDVFNIETEEKTRVALQW